MDYSEMTEAHKEMILHETIVEVSKQLNSIGLSKFLSELEEYCAVVQDTKRKVQADLKAVTEYAQSLEHHDGDVLFVSVLG